MPPSKAHMVVIMMWPESQQAGLVNRIPRIHPFVSFGRQREIDHHDRVLLHNSDQQDDPDHADEVQIGLEQDHGHQRSNACRRQRGNDRQGMNQAFVQNITQHDIDGKQRRSNQNGLIVQRLLIWRARGACKTCP